MDNQRWLSGADSGESCPPVPAPRYKRKLTTYEDSKQMSNKPTDGNVETNKMPPPRRKNKIKITNETKHAYLRSEHQISSNLLNKTVINNNIDTYSNIFTNGNDEKMLCADKVVQIQDTLGYHVETLSTGEFQVQDVLGQVKNPRKSFFNSIDSHSPPDNFGNLPSFRNVLKNGVNSNSSKNSAMVIGMFLKPEHTPSKYETCELIWNQAISNQEGNIVETCSAGGNIVKTCSAGIDKETKPSPTSSASGKTDKNTRLYAEENENGGNISDSCVKDLEENDSGVYFSDTKSPSHIGTSLENIKCYEPSSHIASNGFIGNETENDTKVYEPLSSNNSDNIDNKHIDNLVSDNYSVVLNCFEAETVSSFHTEFANRFSFCKEEIIKESIVEGCLNSEVHLSRKNNFGMSAYLRNMLETDSSMHSVPPCPVSADDEHFRSECCLGEIEKTSQSITDSKSKPACTVVSSVQNKNGLSQVADNNVDLIGDINNVYSGNVNSYAHCENENTLLNESKYVYSRNNSDKSSEDMENTYQKKSCVDELIEDHIGNVLIANNILNNGQCAIADDKSSDLIISNNFKTKTCDSHPLIRRGVVSTLVAFFDTVHTLEMMSNNDFDSRVDQESDISSLTSPEDIEEMNSNKLTSPTSSDLNEFSESIDDFNAMHENEAELEDFFLNVSESSKNELTGLNKFVEVSSSKSTSPTSLDLYEYSSSTDGLNNIKIKTQTEDSFLNESIHNELQIISDQTWLNTANHLLTFVSRNSDNISLLANTDSTPLGATSKCELNKFNSIDDTKDSQNAFGSVHYSYSMVNDEEDALFDINSGLELLHMNDNDVCDSINNIDSLEKNVIIETQGGDGKSLETSFLSNAITLHPHDACTTSKTTIFHKEEDNVLDPTNKELNFPSLDLSVEIKSTKNPFVLSKTKSVSTPIRTIELNSLENGAMDENNSVYDSEEVGSKEVGSKLSKREILLDVDASFEDEFTFCIVLEKNWGSLGIKLKADEEGVLVNDVLPGGSADCSGLVYAGS